MKSAQLGWSEALNCLIGYFAHIYPSPVLMVQPTLDLAKAYSKERIAPMIAATPVLAGLVRESRARDSGNTTLHKEFPGGHLSIVGANSPAGLRSRPVRVLLLDEVDAYPQDAGGEGSPIRLAVARTQTFADRKVFVGSTPTVKNSSAIEAAYARSDQRQFLVPCPACDTGQELVFRNLKWDEDDSAHPYYVCEHCGFVIDQNEREEIVARGVWTPQAEFTGVAGFRLNGLYSPWVTWAELVRSFLDVKSDPIQLKSFVNTALGECWEESRFEISSDDAATHREEYEQEIPSPVCLLTAGVDVQGDRFEIEVLGWGPDYETWSIDYQTLYGDPATAEAWTALSDYLLTEYEGAEGKKFTIAGACVDAGGHHSAEVYRFCRDNSARRWWAVRGSNVPGRPIVPTTQSKTARGKYHLIGTEAAKEWFHSKLKLSEPGPGYCHFPSHYPDEYFRQLLAEEPKTKLHNGFPVRRYVKIRNRNEALDCRVYAIAAMHVLRPNWQELTRRTHHRAAEPPPQQKKQPFHKNSSQRNSFIHRWKL